MMMWRAGMTVASLVLTFKYVLLMVDKNKLLERINIMGPSLQ